MTASEHKRKIFEKLLQTKPKLSVFEANLIANRLLKVDDLLQQNLLEWLENKRLSDIWINEKYCVAGVMRMRGSKDFVSALISLDDYAKDIEKEDALWNLNHIMQPPNFLRFRI